MTDPDAIALVKPMDGLPLALALAGNYLSDNNSINCRQYLDRHEEEWVQLQNETQRLPSYRGTLDSCWIITFNKIVKDSLAYKIVCDWTFLDSQDVWFELVGSSTTMTDAGVTISDFDKAKNLLLDYGIVEVASDPSSDVNGSRGYNMQKTAHAWLVNRFKDLLYMHPTLERMSKYSAAIELGGSSFQDLHRLLPHANRCYDFIMQEKKRVPPSTERGLITIFVDTVNLENLARLFQRASYGKSRGYSIFLSMLYLENPEKAHAVKAEKLLLLALRNIEKTDTMNVDNNDLDESLFEHLAFLRFDLLSQLKSLYRHNSEFLKSEAVMRQKVRLHISRNEIWQACLSLTEFVILSSLSVILLASVLMFMALSTRVLGNYLKTLPDIESIHGILTLPGSLFMSYHWIFFMVGFGDRRRSFVLFITSSLLMEASRWYTVGSPSLDLTLTPIILMVLTTLPILFNEVLD